MEARTDPGAGAGAAGTPLRPRRRLGGLRLAIAIAAVTGALVPTVLRWPGGETSLSLQLLCLLAAVTAVVSLGERRATVRRGRRALLAVVLLLAVAGALRLAAHRVLPPADQTAFEEIQTGGTAYRFLQRGNLPLDFRFTTLLAAAGFAFGGSELGALRAPFKVVGLLVLLFLLLTLRRLDVGWPVVGLVVATVAALRWLVIAGGCADEMFAPMVLVAATAWLLAADERDGGPSSAAAGVVGVLSGLLLFEHAAYLPIIVLAGGWLVWCAGVSSIRRCEGMRAWIAPALFLVTLLITAAPLLIDLVQRQRDGVLLEPFRRHTAGRSAPLARGFPVRAWHYMAALGGGPITGDDGLAVAGEPVLPQPLGALIGMSALFGLVLARRRLLRAIVATALGGVLVAAAVAANLNVARMSGLLVLLLVPLGCALDDALNRAAQWLSSTRPVRGLRAAGVIRAILTGALACWLVAANISSIRTLLADPRARAMYVRDEYAISMFIARTATPGQTVVLWTPETGRGWAPAEETEMIWLLHPKRLRIVGVTDLPVAGSIAPGTLVVAGVQERALSEQELGLLERLADATESCHTLTSAVNLAGARSVAAVCVRCQ